MWIVVAVQAMGVTNGIFKTCDPAAATFALCGDAQTLVIFSLVTAALRTYLPLASNILD